LKKNVTLLGSPHENIPAYSHNQVMMGKKREARERREGKREIKEASSTGTDSLVQHARSFLLPS